MAWSVWYKCYEIFERFSSSVTLIHESANSFTNVNVRAFISSTNVICLAYSAEPKNYIYSGTMIINIQPIADIATIPVHWDWLPRSEEHTSELQSIMRITYAVFCLKKTKTTHTNN